MPRYHPGPIRPPLAPKPYHHRLHSPRPRPGTATHTTRDPNLGSGNHDMSRLSTFAYLNDAPSQGLADIRLAYSQRVLGVAPSPLALAQAPQHTLLATQTSAVVTTTCLDYLHLHARTMRPSTALPTYLYAASQRMLGVVPSPLARRPDTHNTTTSAILTPPRRTNYVPASPGDYCQMEHTCICPSLPPVHYF
jgi:hypothetical protein